MALISILLPVYNDAKFLAAALDRILAQTYQNWEFIACDDGSSDESLNLEELPRL
jgi:glycosyltransferase involved in cell wall biosynthesis